MQEHASGLVTGADGVQRCSWCAASDLYRAYHDSEWGLPVTDDVRLFEKLCLEGFQSGLSWLTILRKREHFRRAFRDFDFVRLARRPPDVERLLQDAGIVRHRGKIESVLNNARRARALVDEAGSLAAFVWRFEPPAAERPRKLVPGVLRTLTQTPSSIALAKELRKRGWTYVGPTTLYAFMQAMGLVNDHLEGCTVRARAEAARRVLARPGGP